MVASRSEQRGGTGGVLRCSGTGQVHAAQLLERVTAVGARRRWRRNQRIEALVNARAAEFRKDAEEWRRDKPARGQRDEDSKSDMSLSYEVLVADHGLVSLRLFTFHDYPGTAHPSHSHDVLNYSLREGRELKLGDLFRPGSAYLKTLADYCLQELEPEGDWRGGAEPTPENYDLWNVTPEGRRITFEEYQVGPYVAGPPR